MDKTYFCNKVITIPQYSGTCWFNAILMCILYSQYSRKLLLNNNPFKKKKDKLSIVLNEILLKNYIQHKKVAEYFSIIRPETILNLIISNKEDVEKITIGGGVFYRFLPIFITYINKSYLMLDLKNKKIYTSVFEKLNNRYEKTTINYKPFKFEETPDYIFVNVLDNVDDTSHGDFILFYGNNPSYNLNTYTKNYTGLVELQNEIMFNGNLYTLDSTILNNYNSKIINKTHSIAGITCKNNRYVYNGWIRSSIKDVNGDNKYGKTPLPCELMNYNWNINDKKKICIKPSLCGLDIMKNTPIDRLCFSFNKGTRTVIYVKTLLSDISIDKNINEKKYNIRMEIKHNIKMIKKLCEENKNIKLIL
jgi:hypothetical protein